MEDAKKSPEQLDKINTLREDLYTRGDIEHTHDAFRGQKFSHHEYNLKDDWETENLSSPELAVKTAMGNSPKKKISPLKTLLIFSILFFVFAVGVAGYVFFSGSNTVSTDNVNISAVVPVSVSGGEEVPITIDIENNNNVDLESADLNVEFPEGTKKAGDISVDMKRFQDSIGTIPKNGKVSRELKAVFFGEENTNKEILISIEYRVKDSNALLYKEKKYDIFLKTSPVSMSVVGLKEIQSGQNIDFTVNLVSNSNTPIENVLLKVEYPFGFEFASSKPKPSFGKNVWKLSVIKPSDKNTFRITGKIDGQNEEERVFRFYVGIQDKNNDKNIGTNFLSVDHSVSVKRPFVGLDVAFDGEKVEEFVARPGANVRADVLWANNLPTRIADSVIEVQLNGNLFNPLAVTAFSGFYRSSDNIIIWDQTSESTLSVLEPSTHGNVSFGFGLIPSSEIVSRGLRNPEMKFSVSVKGKRVSETSVPEEINALISRKVKFSTEVSFGSQATYALGPISNHGPVPPKVDQETTYTIIWTLTNTSNIVSNGVVKAFLPSYVKWVGAVSPSTESVDFQPVGGMITWDVGDIDPYTGFTTEPRQVAFQVALTPSLSQLKQSPTLVKDSVFTGTDQFTGTSFRIGKPELTTDVQSDPGNSDDKGRVVQ